MESKLKITLITAIVASLISPIGQQGAVSAGDTPGTLTYIGLIRPGAIMTAQGKTTITGAC